MTDDLRTVRLRVGRNIRQLRRLRGFSQERLAELVGNTYKHIGLVERGEVNVTIDILIAIATGLSVNVADLFQHTSSHAATRQAVFTQVELEQIEQALALVRRATRTAGQRD